MPFPRLNVFHLRQRSLLRGVLVSLSAFLATLRLAGFPDVRHLHESVWQFLPVLLACWGMFDTARCLDRRWSLHHASVLILLYSELMILALTLFLCFYPV